MFSLLSFYESKNGAGSRTHGGDFTRPTERGDKSTGLTMKGREGWEGDYRWRPRTSCSAGALTALSVGDLRHDVLPSARLDYLLTEWMNRVSIFAVLICNTPKTNFASRHASTTTHDNPTPNYAKTKQSDNAAIEGSINAHLPFLNTRLLRRDHRTQR